MNSNMAQQHRYRDVRKVTLIGSAVDFLLGVAKIIAGWLANSQALIADGIHSFSDLLTDFFVLYAAKHAHKEADEEHPYGHGRIETMATVGLGIVLAGIACGIAYDSVRRLNEPEILLAPGGLALAVAVGSVVSKEWVYRYTVAAARRLRSDMLMANAWHSRSDAISSIVVVLGIAGTMYGYPYLDAVAAVVVAAMIAKIGFNLVRSSTRELIDTALERDEVDAIRKNIFDVKGVRSVHMLRSRKSAGDAFVDVHIQVDPLVSVSEGHQIGDAVRRRLLDSVDVVSDVTVHIDPENDESGSPCDNLPHREKVIEALKLCWPQIPASAIETVTLHYLSGEIQIELDLPIWILSDTSEARELVNTLRKASDTLSYVSDVQVRFKV
ncbi:MAG TPA: cation diffusion facilitator family transporter [Nitrosomonas sp.]|uniref:cation diffusion facilitator family transporter n=1 Tax=Nitrosomonas sp. TaxID=42353 RepID=UPI000E8E410D|nr:cation diffusion facilitator family transporter [Nitrosomonas sp.]GJL76555.1 MAG: cation diffusion facilitator transporter [Nitrosomonas sp.]HBV21872.1 cation-efflux pump [Nitrosomonas sp.]HNP25461.1 cation diffusion facilitator family transporter [Nitrosomonas sp.]